MSGGVCGEVIGTADEPLLNIPPAYPLQLIWLMKKKKEISNLSQCIRFVFIFDRCFYNGSSGLEVAYLQW